MEGGGGYGKTRSPAGQARDGVEEMLQGEEKMRWRLDLSRPHARLRAGAKVFPKTPVCGHPRYSPAPTPACGLERKFLS